MSSVTLSIGSYSVILSRFTEYDRSPPEEQVGTVAFSQVLNPIVQGAVTPAKLRWNMTVLCTKDEYLDLEAVWDEQERLRTTSPYTGYAVRMLDAFKPFQDGSTQTRANGGAVVTRPNGNKLYNAYFDVLLSNPKFVPGNAYIPVVIVATELGIVPPVP